MFNRCRPIPRAVTYRQQLGKYCYHFVNKKVYLKFVCLSAYRSRSQSGAMSSASASNSNHQHHQHQHHPHQHHGGSGGGGNSNSHRGSLGSTTVQAVRSSLPGGATLTPGGSSSRSSNYGSSRTGSNLSITPSVTITPTSAPSGKSSRHVSRNSAIQQTSECHCAFFANDLPMSS